MSNEQRKPRVTKGHADDRKTSVRLCSEGLQAAVYRRVFCCILMSSIASISVSLSLKFLLDDYIIPLIGKQNPNYTELYRAMAVLGCIFLCGVIATFIYSRLMVYIGQGVLKKGSGTRCSSTCRSSPSAIWTRIPTDPL